MPTFVKNNFTYHIASPSPSPTTKLSQSPITPPFNQQASPIPIPVSAITNVTYDAHVPRPPHCFTDDSPSAFKWHRRQTSSPSRSSVSRWLRATSLSPTLSLIVKRANSTFRSAPHHSVNRRINHLSPRIYAASESRRQKAARARQTSGSAW
jgi:hypothetical protein